MTRHSHQRMCVFTSSIPSRAPHYVFQLVLATSLNLLVYALPEQPSEGSEQTPKKKKGKQKGKGKEKDAPSRTPSQTPELRLVETVDVPSVPGAPAQSTVTFRAAR
jgi:prolactin regulatory element-binding protein